MMRSSRLGFVMLAIAAVLVVGCGTPQVQRFGMVIGLKPDTIEQYKELHADANPGVRDLLRKYNIRNFAIYFQEIEGKAYEFAYYEYTGKDYEGDLNRLSAEPRNKEWIKVCSALQIPLAGQKSWSMMEEIFFNE